MKSHEDAQHVVVIGASGGIGRALVDALAARPGVASVTARSRRTTEFDDPKVTTGRLGGWYAYRAAKAALNQIVRTASIELARRWRDAAIVGLHPGTVDTRLSAPFRGNVTPARLFTPSFAADQLLAVIDGLTAQDSGKCCAWDGSEVPGGASRKPGPLAVFVLSFRELLRSDPRVGSAAGL